MDERLKNKILNYQTAVPIAVWDKIAFSLDEIANDKILSKKILLDVTAPPSKSWEFIQESLANQEKSLQVLPIKKKAVIVRILKYAAAASIAGLILFGINGLFTNNPESNSVAINIPTELQTQEEPKNFNTELQKKSILQQNQQLTFENKSITGAHTSISKKNRNEFEKKTLSPTIISLSEPVIASASVETKISAAWMTNSISAEINSLVEYENNHFLTFIGADGSMIKMSKKIASSLGCVVGPNLSVGISCMEQLQTWREKVARLPITASSDNFMDIIHIIKTIKDNP